MKRRQECGAGANWIFLPGQSAVLFPALGSLGGEGWDLYLCEGSQFRFHEGEELRLGEGEAVTVLPGVPLEDGNQRLDAPLGLCRAGHFCLGREREKKSGLRRGQCIKEWKLENTPENLISSFWVKADPKGLGRFLGG